MCISVSIHSDPFFDQSLLQMDSDSWNSARLSTSSRRHQSRSDLCFGGNEEIEGDDDSKVEFLCPFCAEDFDIVGLCCHIDEEHPVEAKNGVCPVCKKRVGLDLVSHITMQHGSFLKVQRKRRFRKGGSGSTISVFKKELREGHLQSLISGFSGIFPSKGSEPDPLLASFMSTQRIDESTSIHPCSSFEANSVKESSDDDYLERNLNQALSDKDRKERTLKSEFVQELLLSTILDGNL